MTHPLEIKVEYNALKETEYIKRSHVIVYLIKEAEKEKQSEARTPDGRIRMYSYLCKTFQRK